MEYLIFFTLLLILIVLIAMLRGAARIVGILADILKAASDQSDDDA